MDQVSVWDQLTISVTITVTKLSHWGVFMAALRLGQLTPALSVEQSASNEPVAHKGKETTHYWNCEHHCQDYSIIVGGKKKKRT